MPLCAPSRSLVLHHGTSEPYDAHPRPGGYDGVFWTTDTFDIARIYIPLAGVSALFSIPSPYDLDRRVRPDKHSISTLIARQMGYPEPDCEYNASGQLISWSIRNWPTNGEVLAFIKSLGYATDRGSIWLTQDIDNDCIQPAGYRRPGRVFSTTVDLSEMKLHDHRSEEFDFTDPSYHDLGLFNLLKSHGYDGVIINDMVKDHDGELIGHVSYGFFADAVAKFRFDLTPSTHQTISEWQASTCAAAA